MLQFLHNMISIANIYLILSLSTVACSQDAFKHFLFDLTRTADIHPVVTKMEIVGDQTEGIGKK